MSLTTLGKKMTGQVLCPRLAQSWIGAALMICSAIGWAHLGSTLRIDTSTHVDMR